MNIRQRVNEFLARLYVPKSKRVDRDQLQEILDTMTLRAPNINDAHKSRYTILLIETKGKGKRETYQGHSVRFIDFDSVGDKYAIAYVYDAEGNGRPLRLDITSPKNILIS